MVLPADISERENIACAFELGCIRVIDCTKLHVLTAVLSRPVASSLLQNCSPLLPVAAAEPEAQLGHLAGEEADEDGREAGGGGGGTATAAPQVAPGQRLPVEDGERTVAAAQQRGAILDGGQAERGKGEQQRT